MCKFVDSSDLVAAADLQSLSLVSLEMSSPSVINELILCLFLLNPRRGMSAVCMCKLENVETSTTLRLIDDTSEFIMVKGHLGTALIEHHVIRNHKISEQFYKIGTYMFKFYEMPV